MKILVGCECSGIVRDEFIRLGHDVISCDLKPTERPGPHHQGDLLEFLDKHPDNYFDLAIFHPTCTYLCSSGLFRNKNNVVRQGKTAEALLFIIALWNTKKAKDVVIENPVGCINTRLDFMPRPQIVQPYQCGEDASKRTCFWIRSGKPLKMDATEYVAPRIVWSHEHNGMRIGPKHRWANQTDSGQNKLGPSVDRAALRAQTYPGIARLLARSLG